jgi:hypothetical protein
VEDYSVALVQSEAEALHTPNLDLSGVRLGEGRGRPIQLFTERNVHSLLEQEDQFDCIVVGFNSLYQSESLRKAFESRLPQTGLVILHQLQTEALECLQGDLALEVRRLPGEIDHAEIAEDRNPLDEAILNWPHDLCAGGDEGFRLRAKAHSFVQPSLDGAWRAVMEVHEEDAHHPVVVRTKSSHAHRIVVCYLWLEPRDGAHLRLLENMVNYCAAGVPEVAVYRPQGTEERAAEVARRLVLHGRNPVFVDRLDFEAWPIRHCRQVVLVDDGEAEVSLASTRAGEWMRTDAAIVVATEGGDLTLHYRTPDEEWIAIRWAAWFNAVPPQAWLGGVDQYGQQHRGSIFQMRAVLRVLKRLEGSLRLREGEEHSFGLKPADHYHPELERFFATTDRWKGASLDETISTTAAAEDIDRLVGGGAIPSTRRKKMHAWLRREFPEAGVEDQLDIVRCLRNMPLFVRAQRSIPDAPLSPGIATKLREAALACGTAPSEFREAAPGPEGSGLERSLLLACRYLEAAVEFQRQFPSHPLSDDDRGMAVALDTIGRHSELLRNDPARPLKEMQGESVGAEASALLAYFGQQAVTTHVLAEEGLHIPVAVVDEVFRETTSSRAKLAEAREELASHRRQLRALTLAQFIFGVLVGAAAGYVFFRTKSNYLYAAATFLGLSLVLGLIGLNAPWTKWVFQAILSGPAGIVSAVGDRFLRSDEQQS